MTQLWIDNKQLTVSILIVYEVSLPCGLLMSAGGLEYTDKNEFYLPAFYVQLQLNLWAKIQINVEKSVKVALTSTHNFTF
ncbi:hypothetical protein NIES4103_14110 [Nostoc sp. NIES-4103]|nr:hypothetical protein NIES4103_14110 [Nostoc sp. NIES-4103]